MNEQLQDLVVIDVPVDLDSLPQFIAIRLLPAVKKWWVGLPNRSPLKTIKPTTVYKNKFKTLVFSNLPEGDESLEYWGTTMEMTNYTLAKVFNNPELWVDVEDVRPGG